SGVRTRCGSPVLHRRLAGKSWQASLGRHVLAGKSWPARIRRRNRACTDLRLCSDLSINRPGLGRWNIEMASFPRCRGTTVVTSPGCLEAKTQLLAVIRADTHAARPAARIDPKWRVPA